MFSTYLIVLLLLVQSCYGFIETGNCSIWGIAVLFRCRQAKWSKWFIPASWGGVSAWDLKFDVSHMSASSLHFIRISWKDPPFCFLHLKTLTPILSWHDGCINHSSCRLTSHMPTFVLVFLHLIVSLLPSSLALIFPHLSQLSESVMVLLGLICW